MKIFFGISAIITALFVLMTIAIFWKREDPYIPTEGIWYCDELQLQISFDADGDTFKVVEGNKIACSWEHDKYSTCITVTCSNAHQEFYWLGEAVFTGTFVKLDAEQYILSGQNGEEYIFLRID